MSTEKIVGATVGTPINPEKIVPPDPTVYIGYTVDGAEMYDTLPENCQYIGFTVSTKGRPTDIGAYTWIPYQTVDDVLSDTSINPVQNKVIAAEFAKLPYTYASKNDLNAFVPMGKYMQDVGNIETLLGGI